MSFLRFPRRTILVVAVVLGATSIHFATRACSPGVSSALVGGPLGFHPWYRPPSNVVPQNVAVLHAERFVDIDAGLDTAWVPAPGHAWSVPSAPFVAGTNLAFGSRDVVVGAYVDTVAPTPPTVLAASAHGNGSSGCGTNRCGYVAAFDLQITPSSDDHALASQITYEIYAGSTAIAAQESTVAVTHLVASEATLRDVGSLGADGEYVAIVAVDQAGNVSARSPSVRVRH